MTTVYVVTAGSGESYRVERVYLDSDEAYGFAQGYNRIAPVEPVQVEEWQVGAPPWPTTARIGGPRGGRGCRSATVAASGGTPATASAATTSTSAGNGGPGTPCQTSR